VKHSCFFTSPLFLSILALLSVGIVQADDDLPKRLAFNRYQGMLDRSPFAVASAVAPPVVTPDVFRGLYVANAARTPEGDLVTVMSSDDKNVKEYLDSTKGPNEHGYGIASIEWSDQPGATKVTISKDNKFGALSFNQALVSTPLVSTPLASTPASAPPPPQPGVQPGGPAFSPARPIRPAPLATQTPHVRGVIQRNPLPATPQPPGPEE
jgi:hypothetical protein